MQFQTHCFRRHRPNSDFLWNFSVPLLMCFLGSARGYFRGDAWGGLEAFVQYFETLLGGNNNCTYTGKTRIKHIIFNLHVESIYRKIFQIFSNFTPSI